MNLETTRKLFTAYVLICAALIPQAAIGDTSRGHVKSSVAVNDVKWGYHDSSSATDENFTSYSFGENWFEYKWGEKPKNDANRSWMMVSSCDTSFILIELPGYDADGLQYFFSDAYGNPDNKTAFEAFRIMEYNGIIREGEASVRLETDFTYRSVIRIGSENIIINENFAISHNEAEEPWDPNRPWRSYPDKERYFIALFAGSDLKRSGYSDSGNYYWELSADLSALEEIDAAICNKLSQGRITDSCYGLVVANAKNPRGEPNVGSVSYYLTITAVPEPETCVMLLAGLGVIGVVARRRALSNRTTM